MLEGHIPQKKSHPLSPELGESMVCSRSPEKAG